MEIIREPAYCSFTGNPIIFKFNIGNDPLIDFNLRIYYYENDSINYYQIRLKYYGFKKGADYFVECDLSDILNSFAVHLMQRKQLSGSWTNGEVKYTLYLKGDPYYELPKKIAIPGGVSDTVFLKYINQGTDVFSTRFANTATMFLLSNRASGKTSINYFKSELGNVWFYRVPNKEYKLKTSSGTEIIIPNVSAETTYYFDAFDLAAAVAQLNPADRLIYLNVDNAPIIQINILPDPVSEEKYVIEFRNSFGFMEKVLLTGKMKYTPEFTEGTEFITTENFILKKNRTRPSFKQKYTVESGYKRMTDMLFFQDLLLSEEVYIYNSLSDERFPCTVKGEINMSMLQSEPQSIPLEIKVLNDEKYISVEYNYRIFDKTFAEQFN